MIKLYMNRSKRRGEFKKNGGKYFFFSFTFKKNKLHVHFNRFFSEHTVYEAIHNLRLQVSFITSR